MLSIKCGHDRIVCFCISDTDAQSDPYPLESGSDSMKYILTVGAFYLGDNFKDAKRGLLQPFIFYAM